MVDFIHEAAEAEDGPDIDEVRSYEIPTPEDDDGEVHPAHQYLKEFSVDVAQKQNPDSAERYYLGLKPFVAWLDLECGRHALPEAGDVASDYFKWLINTSWSVNTRESYFAAVQRYFQWAANEGPLDENPIESVSLDEYELSPGSIEESRRSTGEGVEYKYIEREKVEMLWHPDNIPAPRVRNELLMKLMFYTTCRCKAMAGMKLEPEDSPGSEPTNFSREVGAINVENLKKGDEQDDYRWVKYPRGEIEPLLVEWLDQGRRDNLGPYGDESDFLFLTHQNPQMRPSHISRIVKDAAFNAGIQEVSGYDVNGDPRWLVTGHCIRHSAGTWYANKCDEMKLHFLKKQMGHARLETTMKYVHDDPEARFKAFMRAWGEPVDSLTFDFNAFR